MLSSRLAEDGATRLTIEGHVAHFMAGFSTATRSGYRWRFRRFAQYMGHRPSDISKAFLSLAKMPGPEGKRKAIGFLPWLRSRGYPMLSGGSGRHGITPFFRHLWKANLIPWSIRSVKEERKGEAWSRCPATYRRLVDRWLGFLEAFELLPATLSKHQCQLLQFGLFLTSRGRTLGKIRYRDAMAWLSAMRGSSASPTTINDRLGTVRRFFSWLRAHGHLSTAPFTGVGPVRLPEKLPRLLSRQEILRVVNAARGVEVKAAVTLLYVTGCRARELRQLRVSDVSLRERSVTYRGLHGPGTRTVPLGPDGTSALRAWVHQRKKDPSATPESPLFVNARNRRMSAPTLREWMSDLGRKAEIGRAVTPRMIRHSFGAHFLSNGGDVMTLRVALGLSTLAAAQSYSRLAIGRLREVYDKSHPRK